MTKPIQIFVLVLLSAISQTSFAQESKASKEKKSAISLTAGYAENLDEFDRPSRGFQLGANLFNRNDRRWSYDAQLAVVVTGGSTDYYTPMLLGGGRYYFSAADKKTRLFFNMLAGFALELESGSDFTATTPDIGYAAGFYAQREKMLFGVGLESNESLVFKLGLLF